jgi:hypothetical protein
MVWKKGALCNLSRDLGGEDSVPCPFTGMNRYCSLHTEKSFLEHGIEHQLSGTLEKDIMTSTVLLFTFSSYLGKTTYNSIGLPSIPPRPIFRRAQPKMEGLGLWLQAQTLSCGRPRERLGN